jgi:hypothetical protein
MSFGEGRERPIWSTHVASCRARTNKHPGTLTDSDHHFLALSTASHAEHVLDWFEMARRQDLRHGVGLPVHGCMGRP